MLECTIHSVQAALSCDGGALDGWHVVLLRCAALKGIVGSTLPKSGKRRGRPPGKKRKAAASAERQPSETDARQPSNSNPASAAAAHSQTEEDMREEANQSAANTTPALGIYHTRSTNPASAAMQAFRARMTASTRQGQQLDYALSDKGLKAAAELAKKAEQQKKQQSRRHRVGLPAAVQRDERNESEQMDGGAKEEQVQDEQQEEVEASTSDGVIALLYKQADSEEQAPVGAAEASEGQLEDVLMKEESDAAAEDSSLSAPRLLRCRCSFLLADTAYQKHRRQGWKIGSWCTMRQKARDGAVRTRIGRIVHIADQPSSPFRSLRVLWYRTAGVTVQTPLPRVGRRKREVSEETKTCAMIDIDQQLAEVSPWEISQLTHPPVRFSFNVDVSNQLQPLPKPDVLTGGRLSVQESDQLLTSLCLERLYDQLAGHLHLEADEDAELSAGQQRAAFAPLSEWCRSVRQLREQHVAGTLSGFDEVVAAVQRSTQRLVEAVAYESAISPLASSYSLLALRIACVVWAVLRAVSRAAESGTPAVLQLVAGELVLDDRGGEERQGTEAGSDTAEIAEEDGAVVV